MASNLSSEDGEVGFQIAPMVDVVFVLLLFFMAAAGSQIVERELNVLPSGRSVTQMDIVPICIDIQPDGQISVNGTVYDTPRSKDLVQLRTWLQDTVHKFGNKNPVIIRPEPAVRHERVIDVLNTATQAGVTKLTLG